MPDDTRAFEPVFRLNPGVRLRPPVPIPPKPTSENATHLSPPTLLPQLPPSSLTNTLLPTQLRLAQIVELLHTASLLHDDVIDGSALRRGASSAPSAFGKKLSILGGNFILGRTTAALSRLGDGEVIDLIASVISNLVEGEILQTKEVKMEGNRKGKGILNENLLDEFAQKKTCTSGMSNTTDIREAWNMYLQKTYFKTASLMAKGARSAVILGGCKEGEVWKEIAYAYGRNLGLAFQVCVFFFLGNLTI
jgi:hexaprenyl-diphosphate synthase